MLFLPRESLSSGSTEGGRREVYVVGFPHSESNPLQVSLQGGTEPIWSRDGGEIFFVNEDFELISATIVREPAPRVVDRVPLFSVAQYKIDEFDVTPDGEFLFVRRLELGAPGNLVLVQNFFEELKRRVPN